MSDWQTDSQRVINAAEKLGRAVKPILRVKEGSGGRELFGSAFILEHEGQFAAVTAAHVIEDGPGARYLAVTENGASRWPTPHARIEAKSASLPDPDLACVRFSLAPDADAGASDAFPLMNVLSSFTPAAQMTFLAVGHPVSRGKMRHATGTLKAELAHISGEAVQLDEYAQYCLNPRVHLAMKYTKADVRLSDGTKITGPDPSGMSGGVLLLLTEDKAGIVHLLPAGVTTAFRPGPPGLIVATRMDAVLDHLAPRRPPEEQEFQRAV